MRSTPLLVAALSVGFSMISCLNGAPDLPGRVEVHLEQTAAQTPPIGSNEFGDPGGTAFSAGNLIPDGGFEPMSIRKRLRVGNTGTESGRVWFDVEEGGGLTDWDLITTGLMNGAEVRIYRIVDAAGQPLPHNPSENYLDLEQAAAYIQVGTSTVSTEGSSGLPLGGWLDTIYSIPGNVWGTRRSLNFTDAQWVENGRTYYYVVTAIGSNSSEIEGDNESDISASIEVSATPSTEAQSIPRVFVRNGAGFNEIPDAVENRWFHFQVNVAGTEGAVSWELLDSNNQPIAPPAGLSFDAAQGTLSGTPTTSPAPTLLRFRATSGNGSESRDFLLNNPAWTPTGASERPLPPTNVVATAGSGYVHLSWAPSPSAGVVGYRIYRSEAPRAQQVRRVYLDPGAPTLQRDDYVHLEKRITRANPDWAHPRVRTGKVSETWRTPEEDMVSLERVPHSASIPSDFRFPGDSCMRFTASQSGLTEAGGPYIFFPANSIGEARWYSQLEPGRTYRYEVWMRQEGLSNGGQVRLGFNQYYHALGQQFAVDDQWRLYGFEFVAPDRPTEGMHACPSLQFTGPGTLWIDNIRLFCADTPGAIASTITPPSPLVFDELMAQQPASGEKGILRSMGILMNQATMESSLSLHRDAGLSMNWYQSAEAARSMTVPGFLQYALLSGNSAENRMKPWLNLSSHLREDEWLMLIEYLSAPINPGDPADVAAKPWAYLRYQQRGVSTPWTDEFSRIYLEFANETWHNGSVSDEWFGWGRSGHIFAGAKEFGLVAKYFSSILRDQSPYFQTLEQSGRFRLVLGSSYDNYGEIAARETQGTFGIGHTTYVGPLWERGETPFQYYDDHGIQATLLGYAADTREALKRYARQAEQLLMEGHPVELLAYEGGPSGYSLPGQDPSPQAQEFAERYGKSLAMAVASLEAWLGAYENGFTEQAYLSMSTGDYWTSHTSVHGGYRPHAGWLATVMRNRYAQGRMVRSEVITSPSIFWDGTEIPLVSSFAFRDGNQLSVFILSRKLGGVHDGVDWGDGSTPVTLVLPGTPTGSATLYRLGGDPRATNRESMQVVIEETQVTLQQETLLTIPEGSISLYVVETDLQERDDPLPPSNPSLTYGATGTTLQWAAVPGASSYRIYRSSTAFFDRSEVVDVFNSNSNTFLDSSAVGGTYHYYRIASVNGWGAGMWSRIAVGGLNPETPILPAPRFHGLMEGANSLIASWDEVAGATGYRVGIATLSGGPFNWVDVGLATSWAFDGLEDGRTFFVTVLAYNAVGQGPQSSERRGAPQPPGSLSILAAWEGDLLEYSGEVATWPLSLPIERHVHALVCSDIGRGQGMYPHFDNYGFSTGSGAWGTNGRHYDGKFTFGPGGDGNFGASGGGSISNAIARDLYIGFTVTPATGQSISVSEMVCGFQYSFGAAGRELNLHLRYRVGEGIWQDLPVTGYQIQPGFNQYNDVTIPLVDEALLQAFNESVAFRLYVYNTGEDARYHPASLAHSNGPELLLRGRTSTTGIPGQPGELRGSFTTGRLAMAWNPVAGAESYRIRWGLVGGALTNEVVDIVQSSYAIPDLPRNSYRFAVEAINGIGPGPQSEILVVEPSLNQAPTLSVIGDTTIRAGQTIILQLEGADGDGDPLIYSATGGVP